MASVLKYNPNETMTQYLRRARDFKIQIEKNDYDTILNFLNEILDLDGKYKLTSLMDFKRIKHNDLLLDPAKNKDILVKYSDDFKDHLDYEISSSTIDKMKDEYIIHVIRCLLKKINYNLRKRKFDSGFYYYVKSQ